MSVQSIERPVIVPTPKVMDGDAQNFRENFNRASFEFAHHLAGHPLFELPRLLELAKGLPDADAYYDAGDIRVDQRWDQIPRTQLSVDQSARPHRERRGLDPAARRGTRTRDMRPSLTKVSARSGRS